MGVVLGSKILEGPLPMSQGSYGWYLLPVLLPNDQVGIRNLSKNS